MTTGKSGLTTTQLECQFEADTAMYAELLFDELAAATGRRLGEITTFYRYIAKEKYGRFHVAYRRAIRRHTKALDGGKNR